MRFCLPVLAVALGLTAAPAVAGPATSADKPMTLAQLGVCIGPDCGDRGERRVYRERHRDEGCRQITVRERRGDEVVVKHIRRCD